MHSKFAAIAALAIGMSAGASVPSSLGAAGFGYPSPSSANYRHTAPSGSVAARKRKKQKAHTSRKSKRANRKK